MQTRDHKKLAEMFASEMSRKRIPYICKKAFIYGNIAVSYTHLTLTTI